MYYFLYLFIALAVFLHYMLEPNAFRDHGVYTVFIGSVFLALLWPIVITTHIVGKILK